MCDTMSVVHLWCTYRVADVGHMSSCRQHAAEEAKTTINQCLLTICSHLLTIYFPLGFKFLQADPSHKHRSSWRFPIGVAMRKSGFPIGRRSSASAFMHQCHSQLCCWIFTKFHPPKLQGSHALHWSLCCCGRFLSPIYCHCQDQAARRPSHTGDLL